MKILFLTHYFPPEGNAPASRVHSMCRRWALMGHEVTVITCTPNVPGGAPYDGYKNPWLREDRIDGIRVLRVWTYLAANAGTVRRSLNFLSFMLTGIWRGLRLPRSDVVIATSPQFFCGWAGVWVARLRRRPLVLEVRDIWPESIAAVGVWSGGSRARRGIGMKFLGWLERRMYRAAKHIVTVGRGYERKLLERGVPAAKISVVTNGVESALYRPLPADPALRTEAGASEDDFLVGYLGTVGMAHGLEVVIAAGRLARARGLQRLRFVVVGDGAERRALASSLAQDDPGNVRFLGRRPKEELPGWLASVDACLVHLRAYELFTTVLPSKIFEAAAMGRPILLGVRGEAEAVVRKSAGGLCFEPEDASGLVDAAVELMERADRGEALGSAGRRYVLDHFDLDALAERYAEVLAEVS